MQPPFLPRVRRWATELRFTPSCLHREILVVVLVAVLGIPVSGQWTQGTGVVYTTTSSDQVGIGTAIPAYKLDVRGDGLFQNTGWTYLRIKSPTVGQDPVLSLEAGSDFWRVHHDDSVANNLDFRFNGATKITVATSGRLGVGDSTPEFPVDIHSSESAGTPVMVLNNTYASNSTGASGNRPFQLRRSVHENESFSVFLQDAFTHFEYLNDESAGGIQFRIRATDTESGGGANANDNTVMTLRSDPRGSLVGIGTTTPDHPLEVNGAIRAKEVIVESTGWPDFVFGEDYPRPSLDDWFRHVEEHGHLPGVPSAAEVGENGVGLGATQRALLRKIEEMALIIRAQEERFNESLGTVRRLEDRLQQLEERKGQ